jgi:hypothetical protein
VAELSRATTTGRALALAGVAAVAALAAPAPLRAQPAAGPPAPPGDAAPAPAEDDRAVCIDQELKADLDAKRRRRSVRDRLVQKTNRHELILRGGHYVSDMFDATWVAGGAYAYHLTEDFAIEASAAYTRMLSTPGPELERTFALLEGRERRALLFNTTLDSNPRRVRNIFICSRVVFWASSRMTNESLRVRPRMKAMGAISMRPREMSWSAFSKSIMSWSAS